ncbi:uncharacterized protein LOC144488707, partial [Mustelus asterias]
MADWTVTALILFQMQSPDESNIGGELTQTVTGNNKGDYVTCSQHAPGDALSPEKQQKLEPLCSHVLTKSDRREHVLSPLVVLEQLSEEVVRCSQESSITLSSEKELSLSPQHSVRNLKIHNNHFPSLSVSPRRCADSSRGFKELSFNEVEKDLRLATSQQCDPQCRSGMQSALNQENIAQHSSNPETKLLEMRERRDCRGFHHFDVGNIQPAVNDWRRMELQVSERQCVQSECPGSAPSKAHTLGGHLTNGGGLVHYFWGIPFCPSSLDPDEYTSVILCQLETYEKCLKQAQSQLVKKLEFGPPVLPAPVSRETERQWRGQHTPEEPITAPNQELDHRTIENYSSETGLLAVL